MPSLKSLMTTTVLCAGLAVASPVLAQTALRYAVGFPSGSPTEAARVYAEAVKKHTDSTVTVRVFDTALLSLPEMSGGLAKGVTDIGYVLTQYSPAEYPHANLGSELAMLLALQPDPDAKGGIAFAGAFSEFVMLKCPECVADFAKQNQVYTASSVSAPYTLQCTKPMKTMADLKGARLRVGGAAWARWARQMGASPVTMPGNEMFEALKQKVVDCTVLASAELSAWKLDEVVTDSNIELPGGVFSGSGLNVNRDVWRKLTDAQRVGMLRAAAQFSAEATFRYRTYSRRDIANFTGKGGRLNVPDAETVKASRAAIEADIPGIAAMYAKQHNVKRAEALVDTMKPLVAKWTKLVESVNDAPALADLYWREVYSKVDPKTYGLQ